MRILQTSYSVLEGNVFGEGRGVAQVALNATARRTVTLALFSHGQQSVKRTAYDVITPTRNVLGVAFTTSFLFHNLATKTSTHKKVHVRS